MWRKQALIRCAPSYEQRVYIVGSDSTNRRYRILKIDRHYSPTDVVHELNITEDEMVYSPAELKQVLDMIGDGNKTVGGLTEVVSGFYGMSYRLSPIS